MNTDSNGVDQQVSQLKYVVLAGGVGGAKLVDGVRQGSPGEAGRRRDGCLRDQREACRQDPGPGWPDAQAQLWGDVFRHAGAAPAGMRAAAAW